MKKHIVIIETKKEYLDIVTPILSEMVGKMDKINPFAKPLTLLLDGDAETLIRFECPDKMVDKFNKTFESLDNLGIIECVCYEEELLKEEKSKK